MGGCISNRSELNNQRKNFTEQELLVIQVVYQLLYSIDNKNGHLTKQSFQIFFQENSQFGGKLFKWMRLRTPQGVLDYEGFIISLLFILKDKAIYCGKFDLFALISIECFENEIDIISRILVTFSRGCNVIKELLNAFQIEGEFLKAEKNSIVAKSVCLTVFQEQTTITFAQFIKNLKAQFPSVDNFCSNYFKRKFLQSKLNLHVPIIDKPSFSLNSQILSLFTLGFPLFNEINQLSLIYSTTVNVDDFEDLAQIILESKGSLLFLFRNKDLSESTDSFNSQVFGAYVNIGSNETHHIRKLQNDPMSVLLSQDISFNIGDQDSFLFSILPKFQIFRSKKEEALQQNVYAFLNSRAFEVKVSQPYGIGFGGDGKGNFRIWIDENIKGERTNIICNDCDETYEAGFIIDPHISILNLTAIEVWEMNNQQQVIEIKHQLIENVLE